MATIRERYRILPKLLASRLRGERKRIGLTQEEMADRLGIGRGSYRQLEAEDEGSDFRISTLLALHEAGVDYRALILELAYPPGLEIKFE